MHEAAVAWAESVLTGPIAEVTPLGGGLTSTMLALTDASGARSVLRLMTNEPWRAHGADLTRRERAAQRALAASGIPVPTSLGLDADGAAAGVAAHLMSRLPGMPTTSVDDGALAAMADVLAAIHDVWPGEPFRTYQSWAWEAKWVVPDWTRNADSWRRAFAILAEEPPGYEPTLLHRDFSHRNLLWTHGAVSGVVDWVETSIGPAWLDAAHAATNLAVAFGPGPARSFLGAYAAVTGTDPDAYWLVMDAVGFLPPPGKKPFFGAASELAGLDAWLHEVVTSFDARA
ncbi:aminoglycoside phosphotransferase family protein [Nocardioides sp. CER19]|uniref:phosphotransferase family protein n=1 Tax=Nocardioides sp. CER19 TaxID=3038538 RepID=UPI00244A6DE9|nr:aminoglycoside phosphotransferase family protein [Nocardioides sp. CER19]MDH2416360.1 aminoglycoside phosphotransferase family protein [Nocardioides sp. CER19]